MTAPLPASARAIADFAAWWLRLPLREPYQNALGALAHFDAMVIRLRDSAGRTGWGEACPVAGYSVETPPEAWDFIGVAGGDIEGTSPADVEAFARAHHDRYPFVASALAEAVQRLEGGDLIAPLAAPAVIELAGTVNSLDRDDASRRAAELAGKGYRTLKVKVGYEPLADAERVNAIASAVAGAARLRVDANQGYRSEDAAAFASRATRDAIEAFEQPLAAGDWSGLARLARQCPLPMMLDESIYGAADIERAAREVGVQAIKLKMSKAGGPDALRRQVEQARALGLAVVIGNGVASDLGCLHEGLCFARLAVENAGELNGFLKLVTQILERPIACDGPMMRIPPGALAEPAPALLERFACKTAGSAGIA